MPLPLVYYGAGDFVERPWLQRLAPILGPDYIQNPGQNLALPNSIVVFPRLRDAQPALLKKLSLTEGVILFHVGDEWYREDCGLYRNFAHVIRNYRHTGITCPEVSTIPLGPVLGRGKLEAIKPLADRKYLWCFAGQQVTTRKAMLKSLNAIEPKFVLMAGSKDFDGPRMSSVEYLKVVADTIFVPCPMGNVNLESFRLYEALDFGCIPIVERRPWLDYFTVLFGPHPLPAVSEWSEAPGLMEKMRREGPERLQAHQEGIQLWWREVQGAIRGQLDSVLMKSMGRLPRVQITWPASSVWRGKLEMLRHHNGAALAARTNLTFRRIRKRLGLKVRDGGVRQP